MMILGVTTINGIDLLFIVGAFILLFVLEAGWGRYSRWSEWDRNRRYQRKRVRYAQKDLLAEQRYRTNLRRLLIFVEMRVASSQFVRAMENATDSMKKFHKVMTLPPKQNL